MQSPMQPIRRTDTGHVLSNRLELRRVSLSGAGDGSASAQTQEIEGGKSGRVNGPLKGEASTDSKAAWASHWIMVIGILVH